MIVDNKIAWWTDHHFGFKKASEDFLQSQLRFTREQFIPTLKKKGITTIVFGGDLFDYRVYINVKIKNAVLDLFQHDLKDFNCILLIGNHDIFYNSSVNTNSIRFLGLLPNVTIIDKITPMVIHTRNVLMVPWQVDDKNFVDYMSTNTIKFDVCMCHYAIQGFLLNRAKVNDEGITGDVFFNNFKLIVSGHFHSMNTQVRGDSRILYTGAPWQLSRIDAGEDKFALILNLDDLSYEFIKNEKSLKFVSVTFPEKVYKSEIAGNIVDIHVHYDKNYDDDKIRSYIDRIEAMKPINPPTIKIVNSFASVDLSNHKVKNTYDLMRDYITALKIENEDEIYKMIEELFNEAKGDM